MRNSCPFAVRVQHTGAGTSLPCKRDADCIKYAEYGAMLVCDTAVKGGKCFFKLPPPADNGGSLDLAPGGSLTLGLPETPTPFVDDAGVQQLQVWNGAVFVSTGCDGRPNCKTGICFRNDASGLGGAGVCSGPVGPAGPVTKAEFTLQPGRPDYYDVSVLDGANVPISIAPLAGIPHSSPGPYGVDKRYWCGAPGATSPSDPALAGCSWAFNPDFHLEGSTHVMSHYLRWVDRSAESFAANESHPPNPCTHNADCAAGEVCGIMAQTDKATGNPKMLAWGGQCGRQIGWFVADSLCAWTAAWFDNNGFKYPFCCKYRAGSVPLKPSDGCKESGGVDNNEQLFACGGKYAESGYKDKESAKTCGCPDWELEGIRAPATSKCKSGTSANGTVWHRGAFPFAKFLKSACPTAYSFPFDDYTSLFQCHSKGPEKGYTTGTWNAASYQITFCPGGKTAF